MPIFDRYIAVDWSANNGPKTGKDSIWIGEATSAGLVDSRNPATRSGAMADIEQTLLSARCRGERVMLGFDFVFGFPAGAAAAIAQAASPPDTLSTSLPAGEDGRGGAAGWMQLWSTLQAQITDSDANFSNRFDVAEHINCATARRFWGHPHGRSYAHLHPTRARTDYTTIAERRAVEARIRGPQPVWKLTGVGSVGSQTLLGIPRLEALRRHPVLGRDIAVWPFETDFANSLTAPITLVEIYPSFFPLDVAAEPKDRAQVETCVLRYAALDAAGLLRTFLSAPADITPADREAAIAEEGWIAGVGQEHLRLAMPVAA